MLWSQSDKILTFEIGILLENNISYFWINLDFYRDGDKMAPSVEKKIAELEMGLLHLQQNIDIPDITLQIHQVVSTMIRKCGDEGRKPKVIDFADKAEDSTFLNTLQHGVNRWIREIQKVWAK